jgi:hypothetical protein
LNGNTIRSTGVTAGNYYSNYKVGKKGLLKGVGAGVNLRNKAL